MFRRHLTPLLVALLAGINVAAADSTRFVAGSASELILEGSSNVAGWRCTGTTLDGRMEVAAPLSRINDVIDRVEDGNIGVWMSNPAAGRFPQPTFNLRVPVQSLRCLNRQMDRDMYEALRAQAHPVIEFRFAGLTGGIEHDIDGGSYRTTIAGTLSLAGAQRQINVEVEARRLSRDRFRLRARLPLRMTDFRITPPTAVFGMVKVKNELTVTFDMVMVASPPSPATSPATSP
ncbi:MAG TPA: YceI family protein [Thermoanaerobaculia bacterium]|jgi:hypothetical protein